MLESDVTHPNQRLWVQFYPGKLPNEFRSRETGKPEFDLVDFIRVAIPGDPTNVVERPIRDSDKNEWPQQWAAYKNNQSYRPTSGTPLEDWPRLDVATVAKLKALEFHTVEQLAEASDGQLQRIGMDSYGMRDRAAAYLKAAKDSFLAQKQADELRIKDQEIADLKEMLKEQGARLEALERKSKKRESVEA
jgi:hypothetical protein